MDISPGLPWTGNFQDWPPWLPLVVETARHVLDYTGGTLVMPMTVLVAPASGQVCAPAVRVVAGVRRPRRAGCGPRPRPRRAGRRLNARLGPVRS